MHPVSTVLFLVGYALALPPLFQWARVIRRRSSLALAGHQLGMGISMLGWLLRGRVVIAVAHLAWMIGAKIWFELATKRFSQGPDSQRFPRDGSTE